MRKKTTLYLIISLIPVSIFYYFSLKDDEAKTYLGKAYDTSQQGFSETKGEFIPEQHTDYIFTTVESEFTFYPKIIFLITTLIIAVVIWNKLIRKRFKY